jgi:NIPSNAP
MIHELREYRAAPGAVDRLNQRFADHTLRLFRRHGLRVVGFWTEVSDPTVLVYLLRFGDQQERDRAWEGFKADPEWQRIKATSEEAGPLTVSMSSRLLVLADYWDESGAEAVHDLPTP